MGLGQMLLTTLAVILLGRVVLAVNQNTASSGEAIEMSEYRIAATSVGTSILESAEGLAFDEATVASDISSTSPLTAPASLGLETALGETWPDSVDDFDDFNNITITDSTQKSAIYKVRTSVDYVNIVSNVITHSTAKTYSKRLTVLVTSPSFPDTLKFYSIFSYWYFR